MKNIIINGTEYRVLECINCNNYGISKNGQVINLTTEKLLNSNNHVNGYQMYCLSDDNKKRIVQQVARLLMMAWKPNKNMLKKRGEDGWLVIDHIDGNVNNNSLDNLRWVTQKQNMSNKHNKVTEKTMHTNGVYVVFTDVILDTEDLPKDIHIIHFNKAYEVLNYNIQLQCLQSLLRRGNYSRKHKCYCFYDIPEFLKHIQVEEFDINKVQTSEMYNQYLISSKQYYLDNREICKASSQKYYYSHTEKRREYVKQYYNKNRDHILGKQKEYYQNNRERLLAKQNEYNRNSVL